MIRFNTELARRHRTAGPVPPSWESPGDTNYTPPVNVICSGSPSSRLPPSAALPPPVDMGAVIRVKRTTVRLGQAVSNPISSLSKKPTTRAVCPVYKVTGNEAVGGSNQPGSIFHLPFIL